MPVYGIEMSTNQIFRCVYCLDCDRCVFSQHWYPLTSSQGRMHCGSGHFLLAWGRPYYPVGEATFHGLAGWVLHSGFNERPALMRIIKGKRIMHHPKVRSSCVQQVIESLYSEIEDTRFGEDSSCGALCAGAIHPFTSYPNKKR